MADEIRELARAIADVAAGKAAKATAHTRTETRGRVLRVDADGTVFVDTGAEETPATSTSVAVRPGDEVIVLISGGQATVTGNITSPSTDDTKAKAAQLTADKAALTAGAATADAAIAKAAADAAQGSADDAAKSAAGAGASASDALAQLSVVEDVAGTLAWISEHGSYVASTDTSVQGGTVYFELSDGNYVPVAQPAEGADPSALGWRVLDVSQSQADYIMAHLAVTSEGLWVLPGGIDGDTPAASSGYKALYAADGTRVYDASGACVGSYGETVRVGRESGRHMTLGDDGLAVMDGEARLLGIEATSAVAAAEADGCVVLEGGMQATPGEGWYYYEVGDIRGLSSDMESPPDVYWYFPSEGRAVRFASSVLYDSELVLQTGWYIAWDPETPGSVYYGSSYEVLSEDSSVAANAGSIITLTGIMDLIHPIGSIYLSATDDDPGNLFPGTTWARIAQGRMLVGSSADPATSDYAANTSDSWGSLGLGSQKPPTTGMTGGSLKLTTRELPAHSHGTGSDSWSAFVTTRPDGDIVRYTTSTSGGTAHENGVHSPNALNNDRTATGSAGSGDNYMPAFLAVAIWQRIA